MTVLHLVDSSARRWTDRGREWYEPSSAAADGFIHLSPDEQRMLWVANRFYREVESPRVWWIDETRLVAELRWEAADPPSPDTDGVLFPHLYGALNLDAVVATGGLLRAADGGYTELVRS